MAGVTRVLPARGLWLPIFQGMVLIFLPDKPFHARIVLVHVGGNWRLDAARVVQLVHNGVTMRFHVLTKSTLSARDLCYCGVPDCAHINLVCCPCVHAQRFNLGNMCAQLSVQCGATHAKEDANLSETSSQFVNSLGGKGSGDIRSN